MACIALALDRMLLPHCSCSWFPGGCSRLISWGRWRDCARARRRNGFAYWGRLSWCLNLWML